MMFLFAIQFIAEFVDDGIWHVGEKQQPCFSFPLPPFNTGDQVILLRLPLGNCYIALFRFLTTSALAFSWTCCTSMERPLAIFNYSLSCTIATFRSFDSNKSRGSIGLTICAASIRLMSLHFIVVSSLHDHCPSFREYCIHQIDNSNTPSN